MMLSSPGVYLKWVLAFHFIDSVLLSANGILSFKLNPGCSECAPLNSSKCQDASFENSVAYAPIADAKADHRVHALIWRGGNGGIPTITLIKTKPNCTLNFRWTCLLNDSCGQQVYAVSNNEKIIESTTLVSDVFPSIALSDPDILVPVQNEISRWRLLVSDDGSEVVIEGEPARQRLPAEQLRVNVTVRLRHSTDERPPHLGVGNESIIVDVSLSGRNDERFVGVQLGIVGTTNSIPKSSIHTSNICNDEVMPGVFRRSTIHHGEHIKLQWKPLAFTTVERDITKWVGSVNQQPQALDILRIADYNNSALRIPVCQSSDNYPRTLNTTWITLVNYTFSLAVRDKLDPVDRGLRWLSWSLVAGFGSEDVPLDWSLSTALFITFGFSTPIVAIAIAEVYQVITYGRLFGIILANPFASAYQEIEE